MLHVGYASTKWTSCFASILLGWMHAINNYIRIDCSCRVSNLNISLIRSPFSQTIPHSLTNIHLKSAPSFQNLFLVLICNKEDCKNLLVNLLSGTEKPNTYTQVWKDKHHQMSVVCGVCKFTDTMHACIQCLQLCHAMPIIVL